MTDTEFQCTGCWGWFNPDDMHITDDDALCAWCIHKARPDEEDESWRRDREEFDDV
ncbi:MAG: hypothetical protein LLG14_20395 [Nocardiaceae bacterium]|nr:hypothetical protein [Nocardiaceae bacterium]